MAVENPISDLARAKQHESDQSWPASVKIQLLWIDTKGRETTRTETISSDQFFGHGAFGAPIDGAFLVNAIERMRRAGPPKPERKIKIKR